MRPLTAILNKMHNTRIVATRHRRPKKDLQRVKPISLHFSLFVFIFVYAFVGGLVFTKIEKNAGIQRDAELARIRHECVLEKLSYADSNGINAGVAANQTANAIAECFHQEVDIRSQWNYVTGTLYGFGIITTLGYNRIGPITTTGRLLCVVYGLVGIPCAMIIIANLGQYFNGFAGIVKRKAIHFKLLAVHFTHRRASKTKLDEEKQEDEEEEESSTELVSIALLSAFLLYIIIGSLFLPLLNGELDFLNGIYYNFLVLTAIDFGALVPARVEFLPITFLYVIFGLGITTIAIEVGSTYLKKLHHMGQNLRNIAQQKIWFGGKQLKVRELLHAVGKKAGVDPSVIDNLDLENIVERVVAINEGREPPPDTNEDVDIPCEPVEEADIEKQPLINRKSPSINSADLKCPLVETLSNSLDDTPYIDYPIETPPPFDICNYVAIDVEFPDKRHQIRARDLDFYQSIVVSQTNEDKVSSDIILPAKIDRQTPIVILQDTEQARSDKSEEDEPKKFLEKKQKYGRDAKKLYATYQEEWDRLERLGNKRLGARRRSLLASDKEDSGSASSSRVASPVPDKYEIATPPKARLSNPNVRHASPIKSAPSSPSSRIRAPTRGAVQAAKEALERRMSQTSQNMPSSPLLPSKRFM